MVSSNFSTGRGAVLRALILLISLFLFILFAGSSLALPTTPGFISDSQAAQASFDPPLLALSAVQSAPDPAEAAHFGASATLAGNTLAIGAPNLTIGAQADQGAVYLFDRNHTGIAQWALFRRLVAPDGQAGDLFGFSVVNSRP